MKKFYFTLAIVAGLFAANSASALKFTPNGNISGYMDYIDAKFTKSGQPIIISSYSKNDVTTLNLYDANLAQVSTVNIPEESVGGYEEESVRVLKYNPQGAKNVYSIGSFSQADALNMINNNFDGHISQTVYNGRTVYYPSTDIKENEYVSTSNYLDYWTFGYRYPARCYYFTPSGNNDGSVELFEVNLWMESYTVTDQWTAPVKTSDYSNMEKTYEDLSIQDFNTGNDDAKYMPLTQTLFNDDADYEYIKPIRGTYKEVYQENEYVKRIRYYSSVTGFTICSSNGTEIQRIMFDQSGAETRYADFYVTLIEDKTYFTVYQEKEGESVYIFYTIDKGGAGIHQVGSPIKVNVTPTVIHHDENLNVNLEGIKGASNISVTDVAGRTVFRTSVTEDGIHQIPGRHLSNGMNIVTVKSTAGTKSTKVIVK